MSNILPVVHGDETRSARRLFVLLAGVHSIGNVLASLAVGVTLVLLTGLCARIDWNPQPWAAALMIGVTVLYLPRFLNWVEGPPLLQSTRQVPRIWSTRFPGWRVALLWGLALGSGCYTRIMVPTYYFLVLLPFLGIGPAWTLAIWAAYGIARSGSIWWLACTADPNPFNQAHRVSEVINASADRLYRTNAAVMLIAAVVAVVGL